MVLKPPQQIYPMICFIENLRYQSGPCHIQLFLEEKVETVEKPEGVKKEVKLTRKQLARKRLPVGGDA